MRSMASFGVVAAMSVVVWAEVADAAPPVYWNRGSAAKSTSRTTFYGRTGRTVARSRTVGNRTRFTDRTGRTTFTLSLIHI